MNSRQIDVVKFGAWFSMFSMIVSLSLVLLLFGLAIPALIGGATASIPAIWGVRILRKFKGEA